MTKVALTGATGFIGRHVLAELRTRSVEVHADRLDLHGVHGDAFAQLGSPDVLIHLAWGGLPNYRDRKHSSLELPAQRRFLGAMIAGGLKRLVATGTCAEYGMREGELDEALQAEPRLEYAKAKDSLRRWLEGEQREHGFALTWARLFYMYGDGQPEFSLLPQLARAAERGDRTFPMSGGEQQRDYMPVTDVARDLVSLALNGRDNGIVNVCSGRPISILQLIQDAISQHGWTIELDRGKYPYATDEPMAFWGDRKKLDRLLSSA